MKLVYCQKCQDVVRPYPNITRSCHCGNISVEALNDNVTINITGENPIVIGISNTSLLMGIKHQPNTGLGYDINSFIIPKNCKSVIHGKENSLRSS